MEFAATPRRSCLSDLRTRRTGGSRRYWRGFRVQEGVQGRRGSWSTAGRSVDPKHELREQVSEPRLPLDLLPRVRGWEHKFHNTVGHTWPVGIRKMGSDGSYRLYWLDA